jgi:polysaccharide biosynthesis/export protein
MSDSIGSRIFRAVLEIALAISLFGCAAERSGGVATLPPAPIANNREALVPVSACHPHCYPAPTLFTLQALEKFNETPESEYTLGPGDAITVTVWNRPQLSGRHVIGPDGSIQIPTLGSVKIAGLTANQAAQMLTQLLSGYYVAPVTSVEINSYTNNQVTVVGDVANPGVIHFDNQPTLLEALAKAGNAKGDSGQVPPIRCAIFRGSDRALWLDLRPLFRGNDLAFNLRLHRNDVIYVPYAVDNVVYVMGQVTKPGAFEVTPNMSVVQALSEAGGLNDNAKPSEIVLARPSQNMQKVINLTQMINGNSDSNYLLQVGDIVYVPKRGVAKVGYVLQQLNPLTQTIFVGAALF